MAVHEPIAPRVRLAISQWPDDAPRGAVSTFCAEHGISRKSFYELRKRASVDGPAAVLEPRSRQPRSSPSRLSEEVKAEAVGVRAALESSGLDHGPISVHDKMRAMGLDPVPSTASLARIFREAGVARLEPRKKPRAAWRRFVYPAPNACWQLDATEYVLTRGRPCVIFQLLDDHSRYAVASHVAWGETAAGAIAVVDKAIAAHGVPQRLLSDNGVSLNPSRRGVLGQLVAHLIRLGVKPITGKPYKPTTQGKNERFHQTLFRYLDKQPLAATLEQLQAQIDAFDHIYNTERPHQGLPGRVTPATAWQATAKADPPHPTIAQTWLTDALDRAASTRFRRPRPTASPPTDLRIDADPLADPLIQGVIDPLIDLPADTRLRVAASTGTIKLDGVMYKIDVEHAFKQVLVITDDDTITVTDVHGEILAQHTRPAPGTRYVGNGRPPGRRPKNPQVSPKS